ncbi:alpha/beta fold hydrolase [Marinomonas foliarum]|uniref:Pimeloyl-ACP methyl ester carboxylesterase n=1 Tax=Marinomonas foliarum TaxID=491950 RepID=A0A368ZNX7_9GAMM|nr:alpha/beta hydrolase [Marinomonas foliarum]RCW97045.1 pimeloyl-ACP methyl ester carboxylesterase [Marinomonas foliarum]
MEIYCLPGTMCDHRLWGFTQQALGRSITLHHIAIPMEESLESIVDALAKSLPDKPIDLLGFSMGGYLASRFSVKYPERINRLMVLSNTATALLDSERKQREVALNWVAAQGYRGIPRKKAVAMLGENNKTNDILISLIQDMDKTLGEEVLIQQLKSSLDRPDVLSVLETVHFPLCFALGQHDGLISKETIDRMTSVSRFDVRMVACGHMLPLEQPEWLASLITGFYEGA